MFYLSSERVLDWQDMSFPTLIRSTYDALCEPCTMHFTTIISDRHGVETFVLGLDSDLFAVRIVFDFPSWWSDYSGAEPDSIIKRKRGAKSNHTKD